MKKIFFILFFCFIEEIISAPVFQLDFNNDILPVIGSKPSIYSEKQLKIEFKKAHLGNGIILPSETIMKIPIEKQLNSGTTELIFILNSQLPSDESISILFSYNDIVLYYRCGILYLTNGEKTLNLPVYHWNRGWVIHLVVLWRDNEIELYVDGNKGIQTKKCYLIKTEKKENQIIIGDLKNKLDIILNNIIIFDSALSETEIKTRYENILTKSISFKRNIITIPFFEKPPVIDGDISDDVWEKATEISSFFIYSKNKVIKRESPEVFIGYDKEALYIAFISPQKEGVISENVPRDDRKIITDHDTFEFFFRPTMTWEHTYYQIIVNPSGSIYDGKVFDNSWNGNFIYKTKIRDGYWYGEIKIPYSIFEGAGIPEKNDKWTFNVCRNFKTGEIQLSQWANTGVSYHSPDKFAEMRFGEEGDYIREKEFSFKENEVKFFAETPSKFKGTMIIYLKGEITPFKTISIEGGKIELKEKLEKMKEGIAEVVITEKNTDYPVYLRMFEF